MFNPSRLSLARTRCKMSGKDLAEKTGLTAVTVSRLEKGINEPSEESLRKIANALGYPTSFFYGDDLDAIPTEAISFRSLKRMSAKERDAAIGAGLLGVLLSDWVDERFNLPEIDLIDLGQESNPEVAARSLRQHWGLGEQPIPNMVKLLEAKGIRVFSLAEDTRSVDAFSFWRDNQAYVFLNNFKTPERSVFDAAHELGHLVMHRHGGANHSNATEHEANQFASAFLMPEHDVLARRTRQITTDGIIKMKSRWRVSAMAMAYRLHALKLISDWQYHAFCIELGRRGYRTGEPIGIKRETSVVWNKVFSQLWSEKVTKQEVADELSIPLVELENIVFGLFSATSAVPYNAEKSKFLQAVR
ncbi:XRE family transcriptional regulator [Candidatus Thiothrix sp. Deng01]|uniref:XRE family transcriptional regulator n=1 Tax=Candidatus Thiothrix phosphatis TaxID=3112415 RepID=A0ABU6CVG7_9GAMM|nr:XRE family transcriptional regulator [Candidatus Thiothrix sp. Deng01]MEB4590134.1 XRE family transcriptional regulator [Candidatus Thiothrix sp. Deng01]